LPLLVLVFALLTVFGLALAWLRNLLSPNAFWLCMGIAVGFYLGIAFSSWRQRSVTRIGDSVQPIPPTK
jgi:hypothetical protein